MTQSTPAAPAATPPKLEITTSRLFSSWMIEQQASICFTTYQSGKIFFLGINPQTGKLSTFERTLERVMGLCLDGKNIYTSTLYQIWRFANLLPQGQLHNGYDAVYVPRESRVTGDIDVHDMAVDKNGRLLFVNTLFGCVATTDPHFSFRRVWMPEWIDKVVPEDRCHLNGLALRDGELRYCTAVSRSNVSDGWRDKRSTSGVIVDTQSNQIVAEGLAMPHSPRWHNGHLYFLNSGKGYLCRLDVNTGVVEEITFLSGYARGMGIIGDWAVIGLSDRRENRTFQDLPLEQELAKHDAQTRCGLQIVNLRTGEAPHWVRIEGVVKELYDVVAIPGVRNPMAIGFRNDEIRHYINHPEA
ncbi:MAG: TIGR03032 family protein [Candidatus Sumerlaeia bacterium]|nr:TIGR03032 family protein [Candidatus Sumerlaeia bacterium]